MSLSRIINKSHWGALFIEPTNQSQTRLVRLIPCSVLGGAPMLGAATPEKRGKVPLHVKFIESNIVINTTPSVLSVSLLARHKFSPDIVV